MTDMLLARSVDVLRWLEADAETGFEARLARDRQIGAALPSGTDLDRVLGWWSQVAPGDDKGSVGERLAAYARLAVVGLVLLGLGLGVSLGSIAFAYDGTHPVNVLALLGVLVGVPLVLVLLTFIYLLPGRLPGFGVVRDTLAAINPGRWAGAWLDRYSGLKLFAGFGGPSAGFGRWQLLVFSQWFAIGYFLGVVGAGLVLVTVSDLAFGWSSTLDLQTADVHRLFSFLALPWQAGLPGAVPDPDLVASSRYYRLETQPVSVAEAAALGAWWPFVLMTILVWGLLPRVILLLLGVWRRQGALRGLLCQHPEVLALLDRLTPPKVDFGPELEEDAGSAGAARAAAPPAAADAHTAIVIWNSALPEVQAQTWVGDKLGASAGAAVALDARVGADGWATTLAGFLQSADPLPSRVVIFSKGWEPPLLEFADFLEALRAGLGSTATIVVAPINTRGDAIEPADREIWAAFLGRHGDPRLYVMDAA